MTHFTLSSDYRLSTDPLPGSPTLILTVGLPRSGKSTWAKEQGYPIVSPDAIRLALHGSAFVASAEPVVWATAKLMVAALFGAGHMTVILDACNVTSKRRAEWLDSRWAVTYCVHATPVEECMSRAESTGRPELVKIIRRMDRNFQCVRVAFNEKEY